MEGRSGGYRLMDKLYYRLTRRGIEVTSEIVCRKHYEQFSQPGRDMAPLSEAERMRAGQKQTVTAYDGDRPCATCAEEAERGRAIA